MVADPIQAVRNGFRARLTECVAELHPEERGRPQWLASKLQITREMARKYLAGEALPTQARMTVIADLFGVRPAWLRDEEGPKRTDSGEMDAHIANRVEERSVSAYGVTVSETGLLFAAEWEKLQEPLKSQISKMIGVAVSEQKVAEGPYKGPVKPQVSIEPSTSPSHGKGKVSRVRPVKTHQ